MSAVTQPPPGGIVARDPHIRTRRRPGGDPAGHSRAGEKLWSLTPAGLEAAAIELGRPIQEMGGLARGAGRTGAPHALCVGETVWALSRPAPDLARLQDAPQGAVEAARAEPPGFGSLESWATEVPLPATGTWATAGRGGAQADAVLVAPERGVPLLFVEVDTCHMDAQRVATKLGKYMRFLRRRVKDAEGHKRATLPMWRSRWDYPDDTYDQALLPPLLLVFHRLGSRSPQSSWELVADRTRAHWQGRWDREGGYHGYDDKIPLLFTTIDALREHGPTGPVFHRAGRDRAQTLHDAIGNPRREAALARQRRAPRGTGPAVPGRTDSRPRSPAPRLHRVRAEGHRHPLEVHPEPGQRLRHAPAPVRGLRGGRHSPRPGRTTSRRTPGVPTLPPPPP
ncbi:replication-relaxation family protein [Streptomyces sp. 6N223]|uniref:replication-relaxation family protein n=1 Tax=Streptomyces sp. 6N223 TaxID=3457412 RepID=UPI003FD33D4D